MASKSAILSVKIISDAKDFQRGTAEAAGSLDKFKAKLSSLTVPALAVGAAVVAGGAMAIKAASDYQQFSGTVDAVFGATSKKIDAWAANSAQKLGLSSSDYKQFAGLVGSQLKNAGIPMDQLADKTDGMLGLGADLAAQFGTTVPDAVAALTSALKGEYDPLDKYGISLSAAKVNAKGLEMGAQLVNGQLTEQARIAAINALIQQQSADATGANAREAGSFAGVTERLTALSEDLTVKLGTLLLPMLTSMAGAFVTAAQWGNENAAMLGTVAAIVGVLAGAIVALNVVMTIMNLVAAANPFVLVAIAIAALVAGIIIAYNNIGFFKDAVNGAASFAVGAFNNVVGAVRNVITWVSNLFNGFSIPGWMRDVMGFMGLGGVGFDVTGNLAGLPSGMSLAGLGDSMGAIGSAPMSSLFGGGSAAAPVINNYNINIDGALDTDGVARQIDQLLNRRSRNSGSSSAAGGF